MYTCCESLIYIDEQVTRLSDHNRFVLLVGSSIIVVRLIIDGCLVVESLYRLKNSCR